jgi:2-polyprenyl-6-methoxyphenol hydroxylase-like FAD-dependent oxidoreductase
VTKRALIIGCGVSGPVLAMYLQKAGFEPVIYERRSETTSAAGGSFNLAPNGMDVLETLGLADQVRAVGNNTKHIAFFNHKGKQLGMNPESTVLLNRGELQRVLVQNADKSGIELNFGKRLIETTERGDAVVATFEDGTEATGDFMIGCDGIRSTVRGAVVPGAAQPGYTGIVDTAGRSHLPGLLEPDNIMRMTFGLKGFFGYQALPDGEVFWFQNAHFPDEPDYQALRALPDDVWRDRLLAMHKDDHAPITDIIAANTAMERFSIYEAPTVPVWSRGRICLIGDAAHAMGPHTGQGASMALEDAVTLAKCLRDNDDIPQAFAAYIAARKPRVTEVIAQTRRTGAQKSPGPLGRMIRDLVLPMFLKQQVGKTTALYQHHIDW